MKTALNTIGLLLLFTLSSYAQTFHVNYDWDKEPKLTELNKEMAAEPSVGLLNLKVYDYFYDPTNNNYPAEILTIHVKTQVNSDEAIERNNRVYIPMGSAVKLIEAKARVIKKDGKIVNFNKDNIKSSSDLDEEGEFQFFAIDGVEKGSEIEYLYVVQKNPYFNGRSLSFQDNAWSLNNVFKVFAPSNLGFSFLSLNGFPEVEIDTNYTEVNAYSAKIDTLEPLYSEEFAAYRANLAGVVYKLENNGSKKNLVNYAEVAANYWSNSHPELSKSAKKTISKIISKELKIKGDEPELERVRKIESYIKTNYRTLDMAISSEIDDILTNKITTEFGVIKLFVAFFDLQGIKYELGLTSDRQDLKFRQDFEAHVFLQSAFMYLPNIDMYLKADDILYRVGILPAENTENYGLFMKNVVVGDFSTAVGKIKFIPALDADATVSTIDLSLDMNEDLTEPKIKLTREFTGYTAANLQPLYNLMDEENKTSISESMMKLPGESAEVVEYTVENIDEEDINVKPLKYVGTITYPDLIEKAGEKVLLKVGELIGPQVPLYQEKVRKLPVENDHNRAYVRTLKIELPKGYKAQNLDDLKFDIVGLDNTIGFTSTYELKGQTLIININEYYNQISYPLSDFEEYKKVINAAADFNKVVLVLVKM